MLSAEFADEARRRGQQLITWVVNDDETARRAHALGVDAVVSDDPLRLRWLDHFK
jgi:glycerophosphoryl diester phosphodiesterase